MLFLEFCHGKLSLWSFTLVAPPAMSLAVASGTSCIKHCNALQAKH